MNNTNIIVICRDNFKTEELFQNNVRDVVITLLANRYIMTVKYDEPGLGIIVIEYQHDNLEYGCDYPYWLSPSEIGSVRLDGEEEE